MKIPAIQKPEKKQDNQIQDSGSKKASGTPKKKKQKAKTDKKEKKRKKENGIWDRFKEIRQEVSDERNHQAVSHLWRELCYLLAHLKPAEGILILDPAAQVRYANTAACMDLYADRHILLGSALSGVPAAAPLRANVAAVLERGEPGSLDLPLPDGRTARASVFPFSAGSMTGGALIVILDVTAERESTEVRRQFFASAEEILRTPARNIKGFAELLASDMPLGGNKQQEISKRMLREAANLNQLIGNLMVLSRMENGDLSFSRVQLDLADVVRSCCDNTAQRAQQLGVTLSHALVSCPLYASLWEMGELVSDLLDNALRYNRAGGSVFVNLSIENHAPCLRVTNTGDPIPPEQARRIFERFYRAGRGRSPGGAGLGLAIVKHIAGNYGATVTVTPPPEGNTFTVRFPCPSA